jgi:hypothetical protein
MLTLSNALELIQAGKIQKQYLVKQGRSQAIWNPWGTDNDDNKEILGMRFLLAFPLMLREIIREK